MIEFRRISTLLLSTLLSLLIVSSIQPAEASDHIAVAKWQFSRYQDIVIILLFLLFVVGVKMSYHNTPYIPSYVPESLVLIIVGVGFGAVIRYGFQRADYSNWRLTPNVFFFYLLPAVVLEASYSLYNRTFGEFLGVVLIFAVFGTIICFLLIGALLYAAYVAGALGPPPLTFDIKNLLLFSSLIVAVDPVAVLAIFQAIGVNQRLYFIVFGESLLNDAITVVLYEIMSAFSDQSHVSTKEIFVGIASFFTVSFGGFLIGLILGVLSCLITRIRSHLNAFTLLLMAYFAYIIADTISWSGIISMIGCGLVQAAYAFHNLDVASLEMLKLVTKLAAEICEAVIFLFLGTELLARNLEWHTGFVLWSLVLCLFARTIVVLSITAIINAVNVDDSKISLSEQIVLIYGGLRGAVAFALVVLIDVETENREVFITATLFIILFTVGIMGLTIKPLVKLLKIGMADDKKLSLFSTLNQSCIDQLLTGIEVIVDNKGRNHVRDFFIRLDEKYIRKVLQRDPLTQDQKMMKVYEEIALKLHYAILQPERGELLNELTDNLREKCLALQRSDVDLVVDDYDDDDIEKGGELFNTTTPIPDNPFLASNTVELDTSGRRCVGFSSTLRHALQARRKGILLPGQQDQMVMGPAALAHAHETATTLDEKDGDFDHH